jgi:hypothetical protein
MEGTSGPIKRPVGRRSSEIRAEGYVRLGYEAWLAKRDARSGRSREGSSALLDSGIGVGFEGINRGDGIASRGQLGDVHNLLDHAAREASIPTQLRGDQSEETGEREEAMMGGTMMGEGGREEERRER